MILRHCATAKPLVFEIGHRLLACRYKQAYFDKTWQLKDSEEVK